MKIALEIEGMKISYEDDRNFDIDGGEIKDIFSRMLTVATYPPSVIDADGGKYMFVADDEEVVKKSDKE